MSTHTRSPWPPTAEQEDIVTAAVEGAHLAVLAGAGTGKTATLALAGRALAPRRGLYLAFNRAIAVEARKRMPANIDAFTAHALAYRAVGHRYHHRLRGRRLSASQTAAVLGITAPLALGEQLSLSPAALAVQAMAMVRRYCHSADTDLHTGHAPRVPGLDRLQARHLAQHLLPLARLAWADLQLPDGEGGVLRFTHDHYFKLWALSEPRLDYDVVFLDEAQDTNHGLAQVVRAQHAQQIIVGDSAQAIYGWRGVPGDVLERWPARHRLCLTRSWRFGERLAEEANVCLEQVGVPMRLSGNPARESTLGPIEGPAAVLCRTNAGAVGRALVEMSAGRRVALIGGADGIRRMAQAAHDLKNGLDTNHPELMGFSTWGQVRDYVDQAPEEAGELRTFADLVDEHGPQTILSATARMGNEADAQVVCGTAHKAKGREWDTVEIERDFREPPAREEGVPAPLPRTEAMLAYVTVTRARYRLDNAGLAWIHDRSTTVPTPPPRTVVTDIPRRGALPGERPRPVQAWPDLDLKATYIANIPGRGEVVITPKVKERVRRGHARTIVTGLHPLMAHKLAALDGADRSHVEMLLHGAQIAITDQIDDTPDNGLVVSRDRGRLMTGYQGHPDLTREDVLDLAEHLRAHLHGGPPPHVAATPAPAAVEEDLWPHIAARPRGQGTRADLREAIALFLAQGVASGIDPDAVAAAVVARYGLTCWENLDEEQVRAVLADADTGHQD